MRTVDLRSDTVTRPGPAMRRAMADADVGDDVWREDPTARRLEERAAELLGHEAALFVPSGTMANQIALLLHCRPGEEALVARHAHVRLYETGGAAAWAGVQLVEIGDDGRFEPDDVSRALPPDDSHAARLRLLAIENTHNRAGGRAWPMDRLEAVVARARSHGLALHLDGARVWNAAVARGVAPAAIAAPFDTVSACFSKGLGAPAGSVIAGSRALVAEALRVRKRLGGGMRQVGVLCAAALYALEHHRARLADDHANAQRLAKGLADAPGLSCDASRVDTNIVLVSCGDPRGVTERAAAEGVRIAPFGQGAIRAVTHLDVDTADIDRAIEVLRRAALA